MNCQLVQDELLLKIGMEILPDDLQAHIDGCPDCKAFWDELSSAIEAAGNDENFFLDQTAVDAAVVGVDRRIDKLELGKVTDVRSTWMSYVPAAAAIVLAIGMSFAAYMMGWFDSGSVMTDQSGEDTLVADIGNVANIVDEDVTDYILYEFAADRRASASELLMDDLSEEEMEYLENNFDVGELL